MSEATHTYIGDGVYVEYDGYGVWLKANDHEYPTDRIYLEPDILANLTAFMARMQESKQ